jgi:AcrR family transcriptional regulator
MNQITFGSLKSVAQVRRPTQRALAKQRTREKILAAARTLFTERGYEGATIRDIAAGAGMSTGAVFASFTDKSDLFTEIVGEEHKALAAAMRDAAEGRDPLDAVEAMFEAAAERHMTDLALFQATMSALWTPGLGAQVRTRFARTPIAELIQATLEAAVARGELPTSSNPELVAETLWDSYTSGLRRAAHSGVALGEVKRRLKDRVQLILAGARAA